MTETEAKGMPAAAITAAGMRIMRLLVGNPPQTVAELIKSTGVTRTAVTEQLHELVGAGLVKRTTQRLASRGRPRHLFAATNASLQLLFTGNQWLLVPAIWGAIREIGGERLHRRLLKRVSRAMADHYRPQVTGKTAQERLAQMTQLLREEGNLVEIEEPGNGHVVMRRRSCPFISMYDGTRTVCSVDQEVMSLVLGTRVRQLASRHDGNPCCSFEIKFSHRK